MRSRKSTGINDAITRLITDLNERQVIVEGKRDVAALARVGVRANVLTLDKLQHMRCIPGDDAVILTDFDRAGKAKLKKAESVLIGKGIRIDAGLRERFRRIFGITTIEELPRAFERLVREHS
ncbi:MAG: hypothetical protein N3G76_02585 [Candidatus Micrarchaeota archaeon]|nr:hypothetical protein [Candidatus Micrarchaeota archaeon]